MPVTIGIDARTFYYADSVARGIGHYSLYHLLAIVRAMPDTRFVLYADTLEPNTTLKPVLEYRNVSLRLINDYNSSDIDLFHICDPMNYLPGFESPLNVFRHPNTTVTFYDLIPLHLYLDKWPKEQQQIYIGRLQQLSHSNCRFLAISEYTRKDLIENLQISDSRAFAIMAGLNSAINKGQGGRSLQPEQVRRRFGISKPFFLHVGVHDPHKNFNAAYKAFAECQRHNDIQLVVVGKLNAQMQADAQYAAENGLTDVIFTGFVTREALEALYHEAVSVLFLSRFEGFGFPVLEAMANGCPVITTNVTSIPEVAGNAALMYAPDDISLIAAAMGMLLSNPSRRSELIEAGYLQAARFTWEKTAEKTIAVWHTMLQENKRPPESFQGTSPDKNISVMLDISVLGLAQYDPSSRTGVFRVVEHLAQGLAACPDIDLHFCSTQHLSEHAPHTVSACREYLAEHVEFRNIPFYETNYPKTDIFHSPFHPLPQQADAAVLFQTIYDLIPILYPQLFQGRYNPLPGIIAGIKPGNHALCISASTREDLCRTTGMNISNAHITYIAANSTIFYPCTDAYKLQKIRHTYNIGSAPYLLSLCTLEPRKNIDHVIRAFAQLVRSGHAGDTRLVLTGTKGWDFNRIFNEIDQTPELYSRIVLTGYVPDEDLAALYSGATAFVYMSFYEGFGLPPLEAMQCGVPVITSNTSSLPEVVGDAGIILDPQDLVGLCKVLQEVIANHELRMKMSKRSLLKAANFSWDRCVTETVAAYQLALKAEEKISITSDGKKTPLKLYFYRPKIDFSLVDRVCGDLVPLLLGTKLEQMYEVKTDPTQWRFHPVSHNWRNNPLWDGYSYDPDLFVIAESPNEADYFVFPYMLDEMIEGAWEVSLGLWLRNLPYYKSAPERHIFMSFHDSSEPFGMDALFFRASVNSSHKDPNTFALPYPVENFRTYLHFEPEQIKYDVSFVGCIRDSKSRPLRGKIVGSIQRSTRLRTFVSTSEFFHGLEESHVRAERRELFLTSLSESWLVICPRGTGENSYRFFETLSMGRIPVLLSDNCTLPFEGHIDYSKFILRIPENEADRSAEIVASWLSSQTVESLVERCRLARRVWEQYFACPQWNHRIVEIMSSRMKPKQIVVDGVIFQLQHGRPFGISRLWWSLLTELAATPLAERIVLLDRDGTAPEIPGIRCRKVPPFQLGTARDESSGLDRVCCEENAGLFVSTYYTFTATTPSLLMLYDMIPERFDTVGPDAPNLEWRDKYHAIVNSTSFAAISQSTARDLTTFYPEAAQRPLTVIPCAVADDFRAHSEEEIAAFKASSGIDRPYFLLVGRRDTHKNAALFFQGFARLPDRGHYAIVMAGGGNALEPELRELAGPAAGYAGFFSDQDLSLAYSGAIALVYPSLYEGFGLPILEAMRSGCPVITCQNSSLAEVAGSAALYVGEHDPQEISQALLAVQQPDVRGYLIKRGLERARMFSWQKSAELLADVVQKNVGASGAIQTPGGN